MRPGIEGGQESSDRSSDAIKYIKAVLMIAPVTGSKDKDL